MGCVKTGCHVYVEEYDEYVYGDAFAVDGYSPQSNYEIAAKGIQVQAVHCFRIVQRSKEPITRTLHFTVHKIAEWWDKGHEAEWNSRINSTLLSGHVTNHGYEGKIIV